MIMHINPEEQGIDHWQKSSENEKKWWESFDESEKNEKNQKFDKSVSNYMLRRMEKQGLFGDSLRKENHQDKNKI